MQGKVRLDAYLASQLPDASRAKISASIKAGLIIINKAVVSKPSYTVKAGDAITAALLPPEPCTVRLAEACPNCAEPILELMPCIRDRMIPASHRSRTGRLMALTGALCALEWSITLQQGVARCISHSTTGACAYMLFGVTAGYP